MTVPESLRERILGHPGPGGVPLLRRDVAARLRQHPEDDEYLREAMQAVEQVAALRSPPP